MLLAIPVSLFVVLAGSCQRGCRWFQPIVGSSRGGQGWWRVNVRWGGHQPRMGGRLCRGGGINWKGEPPNTKDRMAPPTTSEWQRMCGRGKYYQARPEDEVQKDMHFLCGQAHINSRSRSSSSFDKQTKDPTDRQSPRNRMKMEPKLRRWKLLFDDRNHLLRFFPQLPWTMVTLHSVALDDRFPCFNYLHHHFVHGLHLLCEGWCYRFPPS